MAARVPRPQELVKTQAEAVPPPEPTVPEPTGKTPARGNGSAAAPAREEHRHNGRECVVLPEVMRLAERVGGLEPLRDIVDALIKQQQETTA